jgi:methylmalonyl-CoA mutase
VTAHNDRFRGRLTVADIFPEATLEEWRSLAERSLRGAPLDALTVTTPEGIDVRPLYTAEDLAGITVQPIGPALRPWQPCQQVRHPVPEIAGAEIAEDARRGIDAARLRFDRSVRRGLAPDDPAAGTGQPDGLLVASAGDIGRFLTAAEGTGSALYLDAGGGAPGAAAALVAAVRARGNDPAALAGGLDCDPLAALAAEGVLPCGLVRALALLPDLVTWCDRSAPRLRALSVSSLPYTMGGAGAVQELAYLLATAVGYLRAVTDAGVTVDLACRHLRFVTAFGRDLLVDIAKLRALRRLWARVVGACGGADESRAPWIHAVTSPRAMTIQDPWVNLVRTTVEGFGAVVAGADTVTVLPFDDAIGPPGVLARRTAALSHALLREESHLHRVVDPTAGSYAVERLTADLMEHAWARFQEIEAGGGMVERLTDGTVHRELAEALDARRRAVADGLDPITGVTSHPDPAAETLERPTVDVTGLRAGLHKALADRRPPQTELDRLRACAAAAIGDGAVMDAAVAACAAGATLWEVAAAVAGDEPPTVIESLPSERDAEPFERQTTPGGVSA